MTFLGFVLSVCNHTGTLCCPMGRLKEGRRSTLPFVFLCQHLLCLGRTRVREGLLISATPSVNTGNRRRFKKVMSRHLDPMLLHPSLQQVHRSFCALCGYMWVIELNLHFIGRKGNSELAKSHCAHPEIIGALPASGGKLQFIISFYCLNLVLASQQVLSFVSVCFVFSFFHITVGSLLCVTLFLCLGQTLRSPCGSAWSHPSNHFALCCSESSTVEQSGC